MRQNITVSLESDILQHARKLAAQRHLSVSGSLAANLEQQIADAHGYQQAKRSALAWLEQAPLDRGGSCLSREEAHAR